MTNLNEGPNNLPSVKGPSSSTLWRSTALAAVTAAILLVTVVLPAEYGVDPTGIGKLLGLTEMGQIKQRLAAEDAALQAADSQSAVIPRPAASVTPPLAPSAAIDSSTVGATRVDTASLVLQPGKGLEIKLAMRKGERVQYTWSTENGAVNFDMHADHTEEPVIKYHGYTKGQGATTDAGVLVAAFDGMHGWFWRNRTANAVTVKLRVEGEFQALKRM